MILVIPRWIFIKVSPLYESEEEKVGILLKS